MSDTVSKEISFHPGIPHRRQTTSKKPEGVDDEKMHWLCRSKVTIIAVPSFTTPLLFFWPLNKFKITSLNLNILHLCDLSWCVFWFPWPELSVKIVPYEIFHHLFKHSHRVFSWVKWEYDEILLIHDRAHFRKKRKIRFKKRQISHWIPLDFFFERVARVNPSHTKRSIVID